MEKYYLHRIQEEGGAFTKGIEEHDALDDAIRAFWGRMKLGFNNPTKPDMTFVSCKICDGNGNVMRPYDMTWLKAAEGQGNVFFLHHIRRDGETLTKSIDAYETMDAAMVAFATAMEYGYNNPRFENVSMVSCKVTDLLSGGMILRDETWVKHESAAAEV